MTPTQNPRFVQIAAAASEPGSETLLFALDEYGRVYKYNFYSAKGSYWSRLPGEE